MPAGPIQGTKQKRSRALDPLRELFGRRGYVPIRTGPHIARPTGSPYPPPPEGWPGTEPEWAVFWAHGVLGMRAGVDFIYLLDAPATAGIQVDFYELRVPVGIQIQGEFWHYEFAGRPRQRDIREKAQLEGQGISVVWIDEGDALRSPIFYLQEALLGRDHSQGV